MRLARGCRVVGRLRRSIFREGLGGQEGDGVSPWKGEKGFGGVWRDS